MAWTSHGHHIDGTVLDNDIRPVQRARCGGPGLCGKCSAEQARALQKIRDIENRQVEERWRRKPSRVVAVFWDGTIESAGPVINWLRININPESHLEDKLILIGASNNSTIYMEARTFLVDHGDRVEVIPEERFHIDFELEE